MPFASKNRVGPSLVGDAQTQLASLSSNKYETSQLQCEADDKDLFKREKFAVSLRKEKKQKIMADRRTALYAHLYCSDIVSLQHALEALH